MTDIKRKYIEYAKRIVSVLKDEAFYEQYKQKVAQGASNIRLTKKRLIQDISIDWIDTIEDALPSLDNIVRNPRKFIVQEEDIVDISLARSISTESVKHLAQHTNFIAAVGKDGSVTPSKILNVTKEETFEIYENRFIYTLLLKLKDFVTMRYDKIKKASAAQDVVQLDVEARFNLPAKKVSYRTEYLAQLSFDEVLNLDPATLSKIERVARIDKIISDFLGSPFAKQMRNAALVRPPITRTNVILKNPDFKKALTLWQFVETYEMSAGFSTTDEVQHLSIENEQITQLKEMVALNSLIFETLYDHDVSQDAKIPEGDFIDFDKLEELDKKQPKDEWEKKTDEKIETEEAETKEIDEEVEKQAPPEIEIEERIKTETEEIIKEQEIEKPEPEPEEIEPFDVLDSFLEKSKSRYVKPRNERLRDVDKNRIKAAIARCLEAYYSEKARDEEEKSRRIELEKERLALERRRTNQAEIFSDSVRNIVSGFGASVRIVKPKEIKEALVYEAAHPVFRMSTVKESRVFYELSVSTFNESFDSVKKRDLERVNEYLAKRRQEIELERKLKEKEKQEKARLLKEKTKLKTEEVSLDEQKSKIKVLEKINESEIWQKAFDTSKTSRLVIPQPKEKAKDEDLIAADIALGDDTLNVDIIIDADSNGFISDGELKHTYRAIKTEETEETISDAKQADIENNITNEQSRSALSVDNESDFTNEQSRSALMGIESETGLDSEINEISYSDAELNDVSEDITSSNSESDTAVNGKDKYESENGDISNIKREEAPVSNERTRDAENIEDFKEISAISPALAELIAEKSGIKTNGKSYSDDYMSEVYGGGEYDKNLDFNSYYVVTKDGYFEVRKDDKNKKVKKGRKLNKIKYTRPKGKKLSFEKIDESAIWGEGGIKWLEVKFGTSFESDKIKFDDVKTEDNKKQDNNYKKSKKQKKKSGDGEIHVIEPSDYEINSSFENKTILDGNFIKNIESGTAMAKGLPSNDIENKGGYMPPTEPSKKVTEREKRAGKAALKKAKKEIITLIDETSIRKGDRGLLSSSADIDNALKATFAEHIALKAAEDENFSAKLSEESKDKKSSEKKRAKVKEKILKKKSKENINATDLELKEEEGDKAEPLKNKRSEKKTKNKKELKPIDETAIWKGDSGLINTPVKIKSALGETFEKEKATLGFDDEEE